jgi:uncharacterized repeat protein (TIGR03803 family)
MTTGVTLRLAVVQVSLGIVVLAAGSTATAQTLSTLYSFTGGIDGRGRAGVIMDAQGNLYGTTQVGGILGCGAAEGCGTVFKLTPDGQWTSLHNFTGGSDGGYSVAPLILDGQGNLYGVTQWSEAGRGAVFMVAADGQFSVLHSFTTWADGGMPLSALVMDKQGNLYGSTYVGGNTVQCGQPGLLGCGTVFKITPAGQESVLYAFPAKRYGSYPWSPVLLDAKGRIYGTTFNGGRNNCAYAGVKHGCGTVFRVTQSGQEKRLYRFNGSADGANPTGALVMDQPGNIYGTTMGIDGVTLGNVFKVTPSGVETVLHTFSGGLDGGVPEGGVIADAQGNLYGTTTFGGAYGDGTIFKVTADGTETVLYSFNCEGAVGCFPFPGGPTLDAQGNLYGTTNEGGIYGYGSVYKLTP